MYEKQASEWGTERHMRRNTMDARAACIDAAMQHANCSYNTCRRRQSMLAMLDADAMDADAAAMAIMRFLVSMTTLCVSGLL